MSTLTSASSSHPTISTTATTIQPSRYPPFFPALYSFPPFYTRQPNSSTWTAQLSHWRTFILDYCRHDRIWWLNLQDALSSPLFYNKDIDRRLSLETAQEVLTSLASTHNAEPVPSTPNLYTIYWRLPSEWASLIAGWIDDTGQKGQVLTLYELVEGEATTSCEWYGMEEGMLKRCLDVLVKQGKAAVFMVREEGGVKFF